jgi:hypothetical protein
MHDKPPTSPGGDHAGHPLIGDHPGWEISVHTVTAATGSGAVQYRATRRDGKRVTALTPAGLDEQIRQAGS